MNCMLRSRDYSISIIRFIATFFIVMCHIMQYFNFVLAWWFNVGVQIFLCMSGFLYGKREFIEDDIAFIKKQFIKILIDYYVTLIFILPFFFIFALDKLSFSIVLNALLLRGTLPGGEHLWYIPYCLFCYLITPILLRFFNKFKNKMTLVCFFILLISIVYILWFYISYFNTAWIVCYVIGLFLGNIIQRNDNLKLYKIVSIFSIIIAIITNTIQILFNYVLKVGFSGSYEKIYSLFCDYAHVFLGVAIFISLRFIFSKIINVHKPNTFFTKLLMLSDRYSYDIYLVHQFFILGQFSMMAISPIVPINISIILLFVICFALLVNFSSNFLRKLLKINNV